MQLLVMALGSFVIADVSVGRVVAVVTILLAAKCGRESSGAIAGVTAGVTMGILGGDFSFLAAAYGFGGMLAGNVCRAGIDCAGIGVCDCKWLNRADYGQ